MRSCCCCSTCDAFLFAEEHPLEQLLASIHPLLFSSQEKMTDGISGKSGKNKPIMVGSALCCFFFWGSIDFLMKGKFFLLPICQLLGGQICLIIRTNVRKVVFWPFYILSSYISYCLNQKLETWHHNLFKTFLALVVFSPHLILSQKVQIR